MEEYVEAYPTLKTVCRARIRWWAVDGCDVGMDRVLVTARVIMVSRVNELRRHLVEGVQFCMRPVRTLPVVG